MPTRQAVRSEQTRRAILDAAGRLFAERGFESVTMREIAREAGCSHTAIYIYFKDKEALLHHLAMGPLRSLQEEVESVLAEKAVSPEERLKGISARFIRFCLQNRNLYDVLFMARATRVDDPSPALEVNRLRNHLFGLLRQAIAEFLQLGPQEDVVLDCTRVYFFTLHGIVSTYKAAEESFEMLMARLGATFNLAIDVLLAGLKQVIQKEGKYDGA